MLSICMTAHNEEENIARALASVVGWADEIIVIDCESSDRTAEIARSFGARIHPRPNVIPEANKNVAFELATGEWILSLDPDEEVPAPLRAEIERLIASKPRENGFLIPRRNFYFGTPLEHGGTWPDRQLRLFRRGKGAFPGKGYHEMIVIDGAVGRMSIPFDHHPYPDFATWMRKFDFYTAYGARRLAERGVAITAGTIRREMVTRPLRRYVERLLLRGGIRDGVPGVLAATFDLMTNVVSFGRYWMEGARDRTES